MRLTREQRRLRDDGTPAQRKAMQILLALSHLSEAERLVPVTSAHVSGASYKMIGDPGLEFLEDFARDARARAYGSMGVRPSFTCTPYLVGARPAFGEHVAWAESNAVCFANSVLGARTNREGGPSALAAAIVGATPDHGLHKDEGRRPTVRVNVTTKPHGLDFSLIGLVAGQRVGDGLPFFRGFHGSEEDLKWLGASLASTGACAMFHLEDVTPEARRARTAGLPSITISRRDLVEAQRSFTDGTKPDVIALGSPQLSGQELWGVADRVRRKPPRIPVWVFTSRAVRDENPEPVAAIESHGGRVLADTCLEVTLLEHQFGTVATPSGKAAYYLPTLCKQKVILDELDALLERYG
ncbi:MAG: DUF521 domain-containing protein [Methanobacteriota archaeon]|nr:MAG: DUF521 domain-containing protein [Euryarchaeota archaeon]